ncbi:MAG: hypothetical protein A2821_02785 [Candidatus Magasanikbacteria bacterium RIFCSPHIGHO2_01_FULL_41_23]|nr:MAG: hypothetical protein A2821_02785 [Candidatus Magasanikbacteria bacterium RIFCSPHIGHO2_01_FULL_41_23]
MPASVDPRRGRLLTAGRRPVEGLARAPVGGDEPPGHDRALAGVAVEGTRAHRLRRGGWTTLLVPFQIHFLCTRCDHRDRERSAGTRQDLDTLPLPALGVLAAGRAVVVDHALRRGGWSDARTELADLPADTCTAESATAVVAASLASAGRSAGGRNRLDVPAPGEGAGVNRGRIGVVAVGVSRTDRVARRVGRALAVLAINESVAVVVEIVRAELPDRADTVVVRLLATRTVARRGHGGAAHAPPLVTGWKREGGGRLRLGRDTERIAVLACVAEATRAVDGVHVFATHLRVTRVRGTRVLVVTDRDDQPCRTGAVFADVAGRADVPVVAGGRVRRRRAAGRGVARVGRTDVTVVAVLLGAADAGALKADVVVRTRVAVVADDRVRRRRAAGRGVARIRRADVAVVAGLGGVFTPLAHDEVVVGTRVGVGAGCVRASLVYAANTVVVLAVAHLDRSRLNERVVVVAVTGLERPRHEGDLELVETHVVLLLGRGGGQTGLHFVLEVGPAVAIVVDGQTDVVPGVDHHRGGIGVVGIHVRHTPHEGNGQEADDVDGELRHKTPPKKNRTEHTFRQEAHPRLAGVKQNFTPESGFAPQAGCYSCEAS